MPLIVPQLQVAAQMVYRNLIPL